jgi:two-component system, LytTR family, response regulator
MIKALIIDDEQAAINTLQLMLERYAPEITELHVTTNSIQGVELIKTHQPQLLFLDIQMPLLSGFDLLKKINPVNFNIIFTTAHDQYAIEAIRFSALDYLLKPIDADELRTAVDKFLEREGVLKNKELQYNNLLHNISSESKKDFKLAINTTNGIHFFLTYQIVRLEAQSNYTKIFFLDNKSILASKTLKDYEEILTTHGFIRTHKSHLVNPLHIINYMSDGLLTMADQSKVEISRRRQHEVIEMLKKG